LKIVDDRLENPQDDLPSDLVRLNREGDESISRHEIASICYSQLTAGHETTTNLLGNGLKELLAHRSQWEAICADPDLIPNAVEEVLRFGASVFAWRRKAKRAAVVNGIQLPEGANVLLLLGSANRDESNFHDPETLDVLRENAKDHLAFGLGIHYCLGAPLARLQARIVLEELTRRLPGMRLAPDQSFTYAPNTTFRGPQHVRAEWDRPLPSWATRATPYILTFEKCGAGTHALVGGKCASLGSLTHAGASVPPGFAITTDAYARMLTINNLAECIHVWLQRLNPEDVRTEERYSQTIRRLIEETPLPAEIENYIRIAYQDLCEQVGTADVPVAVRSSATAEDLPNFSFAGQQDTYLWIVGADSVVKHVRKCWSSLYTARAISYRHDNGFPHEQVLMAVGIQKMVNAKAAGVAMTLNPLNGDRSKIVIDSSWGLGETVVGGLVTPDNFVVDKVILEIVKQIVSPKHIELVADVAGQRVVERPIDGDRQTQPSLTRDEVLAVARIAKRAEQHYGTPQDVEWAIDADLPPSDNLVLLQSRPETVWSQKTSRQAGSTAMNQTGVQSVLNTLLMPLHKK
jgi:pyruvate,water dikinase